MQICLRDFLMRLKGEGIKKIEVFTIDPTIVQFLQKMGFHYRGEKVASYYDGKNYHNEIAADISFFDIEDAFSLLETLTLDVYEKARIKEKLNECKRAIDLMKKDQKIDDYMVVYYGNLAFQVIRDAVGNYPIYTIDNHPWENLIGRLPGGLKSSFTALYQRTYKKEVRDFLPLPKEESKHLLPPTQGKTK